MAVHKYFDYSQNEMNLADTRPGSRYTYPMIFNNEIFVKVSDYCPEIADIYYISNYGRIYNTTTGCINLTKVENGYEFTNLAGREKGTLIKVSIHRLVMRCFEPISNPQDFQVNHKKWM